jgi:uncharacterized membrane protein (UPF0127 family)
VARSFLAPLLDDPDSPFLLVNERSHVTLAHRIEAAFDSKRRNKGLLGRNGLDSGSALVLAPCTAVHTFFMQFALDVLFVDRSGRVIKTVSDLRPWRIAAAIGAHAVVELPAGVILASGTQAGDSLAVLRQ